MVTKRAAKRPARPAIENVRERILATARDLIYSEGARAVGVDRIVAESGVAKMSLYRWFPSKDELIVAVLNEERRRILSVWDANVEKFKGEPLRQLRAQFESLERALVQPGYRGCAFLNAAMAFADEAHPARAVAREFKDEITRRFAELARAVGAKQPEVLAARLYLLVAGAQASGHASGWSEPSKHLVAIADTLIAAHVPASQRSAK